ncbi:MAG: FAD-binding oxidoreductase [Hyphomicrobiaceae bacterium]|nr:FAD-binding oxidoreductase [Hyphomicrobiaceae bacterium]
MTTDTTQAALAAFSALLGPGGLKTAPEDTAPFLREWRDLYQGTTPGVLLPQSTEAVSAIMKVASEHGVPIVPQGGNTGLVGGQIPDGTGREFVLSLTRMNRVRGVDGEGNTLTVEAGLTLQGAQEAAESVDRLFPLSLGSEGSCTIGGNLSTNAGGTAVLAYGNARDLVLGLEVVLADGRIWSGLSSLRKDNTGYDLKQLFLGSEGTLGIITAAVLKLFPRPAERLAAFLAVPTPHEALALFNRARAAAGPQLTGFEIMPRIGVEFCLSHLPGARDPLETPSPWYVLMEWSAGTDTSAAESAFEALLEEAMEAGLVSDGALAASETQARAFWAMRHGMSEVQRHEGGSIKHDVSVPVARVPDFLDVATKAVLDMVPGCRPVPFGHLGDGNIHFNVSQPLGADKADYLALWDAMNARVHAIVQDFGGSISAEHGIGRLKRPLMADVKDGVSLDLMRSLKATFDPQGILNPGRVLPD